MSLIPLGFWAASGGVGVSYWLTSLGGTGAETGYGAAFDSENNLYAVGSTSSAGAGSVDFLLAKYDSFGVIQWQRTLGGTGSDTGYAVAIDSSDNVYAFGFMTGGAGGNDFLLAKYNSSGTIQWQRILGDIYGDQGYAVAIDSSDNVYVTGGYYDGSAALVLTAKYNSSGTIQWQRTLGGAGNDRGYGVEIDSTGNVYILGNTDSTGAGGNDFLLAKYNSSGTIQWQRTLGGTGREDGSSISIDSSDNVYVFGNTDAGGAGSWDALLAKYNSAGTIQWQKTLGGSGFETGMGVVNDSSGNVYTAGRTNSVSGTAIYFQITKYDSSGSIQWQRYLGTSGTDLPNGIAIDSDDNLLVIGYSNTIGAGSNDFLLAKLPSDGSLTGTYVLDGVNVVYAVSSLTALTPTFTSASSSLTAATSSLTSATSTLTDASASLTQFIVTL